MAVKIRLKRMGAKKKPFYRVVVADSRSPRDGKFIEELGFYDPLTDPVNIKIDGEKAAKWLCNGAQPTETVKSLFKKAGITKTETTAAELHTEKSASTDNEVTQEETL